MSQAQRMRQHLGEASTPGSARKRGRPSGKSVPSPALAMGPKKAGKRLSTGSASRGKKRMSGASAIERELGLPLHGLRAGFWRWEGNGREDGMTDGKT